MTNEQINQAIADERGDMLAGTRRQLKLACEQRDEARAALQKVVELLRDEVELANILYEAETHNVFHTAQATDVADAILRRIGIVPAEGPVCPVVARGEHCAICAAGKNAEVQS
jgi:hypothetical protein